MTTHTMNTDTKNSTTNTATNTTTTTQKLHAGAAFPVITASTLDGKTVELGKPRTDKVSKELPAWQMVVVYRGQHCPLCSKYLNSLVEHTETLASISVDVLAVSADSQAQLEAHLSREDKHHFENINFPIAYGLTTEQLEQLGTYISRPRSEQETDHPFPEPALFVINEQGNLHVVDYSNNPFVRPDVASLVGGLQWIRHPDNCYPTRGTYPDQQAVNHQ